VVDDRSTDHTSSILNEYQNVHPDLFTIVKLSTTPNNSSPKKFALSRGIAQAEGDIIFTTDADCTPPPDWIAETVPLFHERVGVVIGPAPFEHNGRLWDKVLALDNCASALVAAGAASWGIGVTCTGRNLAYRKQVFEEVNGFNRINHSLSGDDDLFLQQVKKQTSWNIAFSVNPATAVYSRAAKNFSAYVAQRRRHVSAAKYYTRSLKLTYFLFNLSNLALYGFLIGGFFKPSFLPSGVAPFSLKCLLDFAALFLITRKLQQTKLLRLFPLWEIFFVLNQTFISPLAFIGKIKWK
jgi:cellulose synthase/poly-beta-1,6-N-acetylglucosamine synthase-like glycosyltransferase